jgi:hypothetical protein
MALIGINPVGHPPQRESTLDKIVKGVTIAQGLMGTALAIPKFMQERNEFKALSQRAQAQTDKFNAEAKQFDLDNSPPSQELMDEVKKLNIPLSVIRTTKDAKEWIQKYTPTPLQVESSDFRKLQIDNMLGTSRRADRTERRDIIETSKKEEQDKLEKAKKEQEEFEEKYVPGIGIAYTVTDAKELKTGAEEREKFDRKLDEMINLRKQYGFEIANRAAVARGKQLSNDLLLIYKNMAKLGILSKSDEAIVNSIIPKDPLGFGGTIEGEDPLLVTLEKFKGDIARDFESTISKRIKEREPKGSQLKPGVIEDGYEFLGGNPADPKSWKKAN